MTAPGIITGSAFVERIQNLHAGARQWSAQAAAETEATIDKARYIAAECDEAAIRIASRGSQYMPTPAAVISTLAEVRRDQNRYSDQQPALPEPTTTAREYLVKQYRDEGRTITWAEHIRRVHTACTDCESSTCDIHHPTTDREDTSHDNT